MVKTDIRNQPAYSVAEAARYLKVAPATLRSWVAGRPYPKGAGTAHSSPLIRPARNPPPDAVFLESHRSTCPALSAYRSQCENGCPAPRYPLCPAVPEG
jgi:hypothetical protein